MKAHKSKVKPAAKKKNPAQEALQVTWQLKGRLKSFRMYYLLIGAMLVRVRDERLFADLHHPTLEDYADKRLKLGKTSLYQYLKVYDWAKASHPQWLEPHPKGFIPDFSDVSDLMWIEEELKRKDLKNVDRTALEGLLKKGLAGELRQSDLREWRKKGKKVDTLRDYLNKFRSFRTRCARISGMPPEVVKCLDDAIELLKNHQQVASCGFDMTVLDQTRMAVV